MSDHTWNPSHPLIGRVLGGKFQVVSFIREGGMAQVFCGAQEAEPSHVAIKVIHPELTDEPNVVARFLQEARVSSQLSHPNIVRIVSVGEDEALLYYVMELLFGDDLSARVKQRGAFSHARAAEIMIDVCRALQYAHDRGVVHRDIKPENVMLCRQPSAPANEVVKVLDFGIAKILDQAPDLALPVESPTNVRSVLTRVGGWVGTPAYMSPEQGRAEPIDFRSDIYSAGVLLYELVTGRLPFEGQTPLQIIARHVQEPPPPPSTWLELDPALEQVILRSLAKDPAARPQSAAELAAGLSEVLCQLEVPSSQRWVVSGYPGPGDDDDAPTAARSVPPPALAALAPPEKAVRTLASGAAPASGTGGPASPGDQVRASLRALKRTVTLNIDEASRDSGIVRPASPISRRHPLVGRILGDRYHVAAFMREGSMAQVFSATQERDPKHVAIKVVHPDLAADREVQIRFVSEAKVAMALNHPNIVRTLDAGSDRGILFLVMELLFGDDLSARVKQRGAFSFEDSVRIVIDLAVALQHAHERGVIHRDIKPENVMLCRDPAAPHREMVKLLDFGIAKVLDRRSPATLPTEAATGMRSQLTRVGQLVGTPTYASPEQGRAETIDHRSDIYSVGVLLYELLCGRPPFDGETALQIVSRHVRETPPDPRTLAPIPDSLATVLLQTLEKDPNRRPQSARQLWEALLALLPSLGREAHSTKPSARWAARLSARPADRGSPGSSAPLVDEASSDGAREVDALRGTLPIRKRPPPAVMATQKMGAGLVQQAIAEPPLSRPTATIESAIRLAPLPSPSPVPLVLSPSSEQQRLMRMVGILAGLLGVALLAIAVLSWLYLHR